MGTLQTLETKTASVNHIAQLWSRYAVNRKKFWHTAPIKSGERLSLSVVNNKVKTRVSNSLYWLFALCVFAFGIYLTEIQYMNTEWFTRAGCLVVVLGVWSSLGVIIQERIIIRQSQWRRNRALSKFKLKHAKEKDQSLIDSEKTAINEEHDKHVAQAIDHLRLSIGALEVSLLVSGTLVWGFGDLLFRLY